MHEKMAHPGAVFPHKKSGRTGRPAARTDAQVVADRQQALMLLRRWYRRPSLITGRTPTVTALAWLLEATERGALRDETGRPGRPVEDRYCPPAIGRLDLLPNVERNARSWVRDRLRLHGPADPGPPNGPTIRVMYAGAASEVDIWSPFTGAFVGRVKRGNTVDLPADLADGLSGDFTVAPPGAPAPEPPFAGVTADAVTLAVEVAGRFRWDTREVRNANRWVERLLDESAAFEYVHLGSERHTGREPLPPTRTTD